MSLYDALPAAKYALVLRDFAPRILWELRKKDVKNKLLLYVVGFSRASRMTEKELRD
jgi:hypothetical protein